MGGNSGPYFSTDAFMPDTGKQCLGGALLTSRHNQRKTFYFLYLEKSAIFFPEEMKSELLR
jgi:hypothetical protein